MGGFSPNSNYSSRFENTFVLSGTDTFGFGFNPKLLIMQLSIRIMRFRQQRFSYEFFGMLSKYQIRYMSDGSSDVKTSRGFLLFSPFCSTAICKLETQPHPKLLMFLSFYPGGWHSNQYSNAAIGFNDCELFISVFGVQICDDYLSIFSLSAVPRFSRYLFGVGDCSPGCANLFHSQYHGHTDVFPQMRVTFFWWLGEDNGWRCWEAVWVYNLVLFLGQMNAYVFMGLI